MAEMIEIRNVSKTGKETNFSLNPFMVRFSVSRDDEARITALKIVARDTEIEIGRFLTPDDKANFAAVFAPAIFSAMRRIGSSGVIWSYENKQALLQHLPEGCMLMDSFGSSEAVGLGGSTLPVAGLFLCGAGSHPGGGVYGLPGRIAASRLKRFLTR